MTISEYALLASVLISLGSFSYVVFGNRNKVVSARFREIDKQLGEKAEGATVAAIAGKVDLVEDRVTRVETDMKHLPDKDVAHKLEVSLTELNGRVEALTERLAPVTAMASRIQEALIERVSG